MEPSSKYVCSEIKGADVSPLMVPMVIWKEGMQRDLFRKKII
jgi:hypothetical protein